MQILDNVRTTIVIYVCFAFMAVFLLLYICCYGYPI